MVLPAAKRSSLAEAASSVTAASDGSSLDMHLQSGGSAPNADRPPSSGTSGTTSGTTTSTTPHLGIYSRPDGKWAAWLTLKGEQQYIGTFDTLEKATAALTDAKSAAAISKDAAAGSNAGKSTGTWREDETVRLIDAIKFTSTGPPYNWEAIADHVKTRSAEQCKSKNQKLMLKDAKKAGQAPLEAASSPSPNDDADDPAKALRRAILGIRFCHAEDCCKVGRREYGWMCRAHHLELDAKASGVLDASSSEIMAAITPTLPQKHSDAASLRDTHGISTAYRGGETAANEITPEWLEQQDQEPSAAEPSAGPEPSYPAKKPDIPFLDKQPAPSAAGHIKRQRKRTEMEIVEEFEIRSGKLSSATSTAMVSASSKPAAVPPNEEHEMPQPTPEGHWREAIDDSSGKPYYYHSVTNEVTWDKPACLVAMVDLPPSIEPTKKAKGVILHKDSGKWRAKISVAGKCKHIAYFNTHEEATAAYDFVRKTLDGCGLSQMDYGRFAVFENAKTKAIEAASLGSTTVSVMELDPNAACATKSEASPNISATGRSMSEWKEAIDEASGKPYYYHAKTHEVTWVKPACLAGRDESSPRNDTRPKDAKSKSVGRVSTHGLPLGVTKSGKNFRAMIFRNGKGFSIGSFSTPEQASIAYQMVREKLGNVGPSQFDATFASVAARAREATGATNRTISSSKMTKGCYQTDNGTWRAQIAFNGVSKHIGAFSTSEEASAAYQIVRDELGDKRVRDSAELEALFQSGKSKAKAAIDAMSPGDDGDAADGKRPQKAKGIHQRDNGRWVAAISINNANKYIGTFSSSEEASAAFQLVSEALGDRTRSRDSAELEALFQAARKKARAEILNAAVGIDLDNSERPEMKGVPDGRFKRIYQADNRQSKRQRKRPHYMDEFEMGEFDDFGAAKTKTIEDASKDRRNRCSQRCSVSGCTKYKQTNNNGMCRKHFLKIGGKIPAREETVDSCAGGDLDDSERSEMKKGPGGQAPGH